MEAVTKVNGVLVSGTPKAHQSRSVPAVQRMLGHASATLTADRYGHLFGDELDGVADRLDQHRAEFLRTPADWGR